VLLWETSADKNSMPQADLFEALSGFYDAEKEQDLLRAATWLRHLEFLKYMQSLQSTSTATPSGYEGGERRRG